MLHLIARIRRFSQHFSDLELTVYAANASFFLLISAFPLAMLMVTLLKLLPLDGYDLLNTAQLLLPAATLTLAEYLIHDLYSSNTVSALSLSAIAALWSASRGMLALLKGINAAYATVDTRSWLRRRILCVIYTLALLIALIVTLALHTFGRYLLTLLGESFPFLQGGINLLMPLRSLIVLAVLVSFFLVIYFVFPHRPMRLLPQLPGAVTAAAGWLGFSSIYSFYLERAGGLNGLYGSLTAVVVTMLWLYFCMCIVFFGAALNAFLEQRGFWTRQSRPHKLTQK